MKTLSAVLLLPMLVNMAPACAQSPETVEKPSAPPTPSWPVAGIWMPSDAKDLEAVAKLIHAGL